MTEPSDNYRETPKSVEATIDAQAS